MCRIRGLSPSIAMDLPPVPGAIFRHPCPRKIHLPYERCRCAWRLDVAVPHGYSPAADRGSVHASRLQNLRWRLGAVRSVRAAEDLPVSLRALAKDHGSDACVVRPLSPPRVARKALLGSSSKTQRSGRGRRPSVTWSNDLVAEVPHLTSATRNGIRYDSEPMIGVSIDLRVNRNMARLLENHNQMLSLSKDCGGCLAFLWASPPHQPARKADVRDPEVRTADAVPLAAGGVLENLCSNAGGAYALRFQASHMSLPPASTKSRSRSFSPGIPASCRSPAAYAAVEAARSSYILSVAGG